MGVIFDRNFFYGNKTENQIDFEKAPDNKEKCYPVFLKKINNRHFVLCFNFGIGRTDYLEGSLGDIIDSEPFEALTKKDMASLTGYLWAMWG